MSERLIRDAEVQKRTGLSHGSIYKGVNEGTFPKPIPLAKNKNGDNSIVAWKLSEVNQWIENKISACEAA